MLPVPTLAQVRTALEGSIEKWRGIAYGTEADNGSENCPLCTLFVEIQTPEKPRTPICQGCPVALATGVPMCRCTPYVDWAVLLLSDQTAQRNCKTHGCRLQDFELDAQPAAKNAAIRMLNFLRQRLDDFNEQHDPEASFADLPWEPVEAQTLTI